MENQNSEEMKSQEQFKSSYERKSTCGSLRKIIFIMKDHILKYLLLEEENLWANGLPPVTLLSLSIVQNESYQNVIETGGQAVSTRQNAY